jgi:hypothetical protein
MTGWLSRSGTPVSKVTLGSFEDMGIKVNYNKADSWSIPTSNLRENGARFKSENNELEEIGADIVLPEFMELQRYGGQVEMVPTAGMAEARDGEVVVGDGDVNSGITNYIGAQVLLIVGLAVGCLLG